MSIGLVVGDFNSDGKLDLAASLVSSGIGVLLGNGDGTFQSEAEYPTPIGPELATTGDFNGDGVLDLAVACTAFDDRHGAFSILFGNGDGTFRTHVDHVTTTQAFGIAAGDLNGDGKLDMVISYFSSSRNGGRLISTFLGNGDGAFQVQNDSYLFGPFPLVEDVNGDGMLDIAMASFKTYLALSETAVLSKTSVRFGKVSVGSSGSVTVTLNNIGSSAFSVNRFSINGKNADSFSQTNTCLGKSVAPGAKCAIRVTFTPTAPRQDTTAMLKISDTGASPLQTIYLDGFSAK